MEGLPIWDITSAEFRTIPESLGIGIATLPHHHDPDLPHSWVPLPHHLGHSL